MEEQQKDLMEQPDWYNNAQKYWTSRPATVNGMLGGFEKLSVIDTKSSLSFVDEFVHGVRGANNVLRKKPVISNEYACDCGAGIGRVTKEFLVRVPFQHVDLVEQAPNFVEQAKSSYLRDEIERGIVQNVLCQGLQDFSPDAGKYDLIWCQWVLGHLTDDDLIAFFKRCIVGLKPQGLIGVKENISTAADYVVDEEDSSVTRPRSALERVFAAAGLEIIKEESQHGLPTCLYSVKMFMLRPLQSS